MDFKMKMVVLIQIMTKMVLLIDLIRCPTQAENKNGYLDNDGCPDTKQSYSDTDYDENSRQ